MFNNSLKKDALAIHENAVDRYTTSYDEMRNSCDALYEIRKKALYKIETVELLINSIANKPQEFYVQFGKITQNIKKFKETEKYAEESYKAAAKSGVSILSGVAAGGAIAAAAPSVAMSIATTFGTASTGTAISALSGAAAQKAALAWIGRMTGGIATKGIVTGAGMASGQAFLALAGPIGWSVSAASTAVSLISYTSKNKKISDDAIEEAKKIMKARELLRETTEKINHLSNKTSLLLNELSAQTIKANKYYNTDYLSLDEDIQLLMGTLVNNTLSLSALLNQVIE